jgi:hypothetical protein
MWVCTTHMKETLPLLETPHISKASYQIKCSLCDNLAIAKIFYSYHTYYFSKNQSIYSLSRTSLKESN